MCNAFPFKKKERKKIPHSARVFETGQQMQHSLKQDYVGFSQRLVLPYKSLSNQLIQYD